MNNVCVRAMRHKYIRVSDQCTHALIFNAITAQPVCELEWEGRGEGGFNNQCVRPSQRG